MRWSFHIALVVQLGLVCATAAAQSPEGRFKLGMETGLLNYQKTTISSEGGDEESINQTALGILPGILGVDLAYGVSDALVVGARLGIANNRISIDDVAGDVEQTEILLLGHVDYVIPTGSTFRPFIGANVGIDFTDGQVANDTSLTAFLFGASAGVHCFITESFSIDPRLTFLYGLGSASVDVGAVEVDADVGILSILLSVGATGWI